MGQLEKSSGLTPSELARRLERKPSDVSRSLNRLSKKGLVTCLNPKRRKGRIYAVTETGIAALRLLRETRR